MIKPFQIDEELRNLLNQQTDPALIRTRQQSGKTLSYINGYAVIRKLNAAFNYLWDWRIDKATIEDVEGPKGGKVCHVLGTLTAYVDDGNGNVIEINKQAYGSKIHIEKVGTQDHQNLYKVASTDALKKAASLFGIAADLYLTEEEQEFLDVVEQNLWDTETLEKYKKEWSYIEEFQEKFGLSEGELNELVSEYSGGNIKSIMLIKPENITSFVEYIKELIKQQGAD